MGFLSALDAIAHGGIQQPESYVKKKNYTFDKELGKSFHHVLFLLSLSLSLLPPPHSLSLYDNTHDYACFWYSNLALWLGRGSFGSVRKAMRISDKKEVAIKIISKKTVKGHFDMVLSEMNVLKNLNHPNVIGFFDFFESR